MFTLFNGLITVPSALYIAIALLTVQLVPR